jgi:hypothetical protein
MVRPARASRSLIAILALLLTAPPAAADWADWPPGPSDSELEAIVRAAYTGATAHARQNRNYFARDDDYDTLRQAIEDELGRQGHEDVVVPEAPSADLDEARVCSPRGVVLSYAVNVFGDGVSIAASSPKRVFSYHYEPHENPAVIVKPSEDCAKK